ncbi:MAG: hypothetical protein J6Q13_01190 [Clostridia bacterium]|nr:hypothetical protein [Clostridia bacterium]
MENNTPLYFAIDSDILRALRLIDIIMESGQRYDFANSPDTLLKKWGGYLRKLYQRMKNDEIRLVIVDAVYQESQHSVSLLTFMKNYCYFPKINAVNYQRKAAEARRLANAYCESFEVGDKEIAAPMKKVFNAQSGTFSPTNDCYIMAQATIEGISLITANGKDFIFDEKAGVENHNRAKGIMNINIARGYYASKQGTFNTSRPFHIQTIGPMLKDEILDIDLITPANGFDLGDDLICEDDLKNEL